MNKKIDRVNKFGQKYVNEFDKLKKKGHVLDDGRIIARRYQLMGLQKAASNLRSARNDALLYEQKLKNKYGKNLDVDKKTGKYGTNSYDKKVAKAKEAIKKNKEKLKSDTKKWQKDIRSAHDKLKEQYKNKKISKKEYEEKDWNTALDYAGKYDKIFDKNSAKKKKLKANYKEAKKLKR